MEPENDGFLVGISSSGSFSGSMLLFGSVNRVISGILGPFCI